MVVDTFFNNVDHLKQVLAGPFDGVWSLVMERCFRRARNIQMRSLADNTYIPWADIALFEEHDLKRIRRTFCQGFMRSVNRGNGV